MADSDNAAAAVANPAVAQPADEVAQAPPAESNAAGDDSKAEKTAENGAEEKKETNGRSRDHGRNDRRGDRRGGDRRNNNNRRHNEYANLPKSSDKKAIRAQVEFYFSDQNLATDKHMFMEMGAHKNEPIPIKHISTFKRMAHFEPYSAIVEALRESEDLVVVDDGRYAGLGNEAVKRKVPIQTHLLEYEKDGKEPSVETLFDRNRAASANRTETSIYFKGFGGEDVGQIAAEQFFRPYGAVMVRKRRDEDNNFKGSVFVEFPNKETQQQFLDLDEKPKWNGHEALVMSKQAYIELKCKEKGIEPDPQQERYADYRANKSAGRGRGRGGGRGRGRFGGNNRDRNDRGGDRRRDRDDRPRRRRSESRDSVDERDWKDRRDRFQNGKSDRAARKDEGPKEIERDAHGVPVVKDTRTDEEKGTKRKADGEQDHNDGSKKNKIEIKEDE